MTRVLVTGGTGTLGRHLVPRLADAGYTVRIMSRRSSELAADSDLEWATADLASGTGLASATSDVDIVVHAASKPFPPYRGPTSVDVRGTQRLVDHLESAAVETVIYTSIVGIDDIPYHYYQDKLEAESIIETSAVPETILRTTQFHELGNMVFEGYRWLPVWPLATSLPLQPIAAAEVADRLTELVGESPGARVPDIGGPEVLTVGEAAETWKRAEGIRRPVVPLPQIGRTLTRIGAGDLTATDNPYGETTFVEWLETTDSSPQPSTVEEFGQTDPPD